MSEEKIGIIGGGLMGTGIAFVAARQIEGKVVVVDVEQKILDKSRRTVEGLAARAVEKGQATQEEAGKWLKRLSYTTDKKDLQGAAFIIEAAFNYIRSTRFYVWKSKEKPTQTALDLNNFHPTKHVDKLSLKTVSNKLSDLAWSMDSKPEEAVEQKRSDELGI